MFRHKTPGASLGYSGAGANITVESIHPEITEHQTPSLAIRRIAGCAFNAMSIGLVFIGFAYLLLNFLMGCIGLAVFGIGYY